MILQDATVAVFALAGAAVLVRRVVGVWRPSKGKGGCASCASGAAACAKTVVPVPPPSVQH